MGVVGCTASKEGIPGNSSETGSFSTVVQMNGKELTVGTPTASMADSCPVITVLIKNSGGKPITVAELEIVLYGCNGAELVTETIAVKELPPGEVRPLIHWWPGLAFMSGSFKVQVKRLE